MSSSLAATQLPFAQAQTIEDEDNQETQQATADVNATQTVTQGNETIVDNGNFGREEDADGSLASLSTLSITSTSTAEVRPDRLSVSVGVETNGTTAQEAVSQNANLTSQVIAALTGLGITEDRIETSSYSVSPIYEYIQPAEPCIQIYPPPPGCETRQEIIGYRATNTVSVTLDVPFFRVAAESSVPDVNAGQVIDAVVGAGANRVDSVTFFISPERQEEIRGTLIGEAISNARQRANIAAEALQMTITGVSSAEINPIDFPVYTVSLREATGAGEAADALSAPTQILPGQQEVSTTVSIVFYLGQEGTTNG
ncbi:MAG TPA: SIMPL domain-containing protein [Nitrososphaera sp.]|nr:SIMPL domain-containing protein [Nitrososphaera sp.]